MTENQAIKILKEEKSWESDDRKIDAFLMAIQALEIVAKMKEHCEGSCTDCPYWNPKFDKCMNDLLKGVNEHDGE